MRNITVSVPDDVYRAARIAAAERGTSVSAVVAEQLRQFAEHDEAWADACRRRRALIEEIRRRHPGFTMAENVARDELYDRGVR